MFRNLSGNAFAGPPSVHIDAAWDSMMAPMHMRVTLEELDRAQQNSVALPEGGGYLAWLQSFHELHCIVCPESRFRPHQLTSLCAVKRMLRKWNYRSYYHPNITEHEVSKLNSHAGERANM